MSSEQNAKQNIYSSSRKICKHVGAHFGVEFETNALNLIAELAFKKLCYYANDLEAFQKHAKRSTVNADDVKLLVRRNSSLRELVENKHKVMQRDEPPDSNAGVKRKRKTNTSK